MIVIKVRKYWVVRQITGGTLSFIHVHVHSSIGSMGPNACADPEGGYRGSGSLLENHKNIAFLSNTLNNHKAAKPAFNVGPSLARQRNSI